MKLRTTVSVGALAAVAVLNGAAAQAAAPVAESGATAHAAHVLVVRPGQLVDAGHGNDLKLTRTERCIGTPPDDWWTCKSVVDGNQPVGTVGLQTASDATGTFWSPLYIGNGGAAARITLVADGVTYDAQVVRLVGHPNYATGYAWGAPEDPPGSGDIPQITVYDAKGRILARS